MEQYSLSEQSAGFLKQAKKWAYILSIIGFVGVGFMLMAGIITTIIFSVIDVFANIPDKPNFPFGLLGLLYIILAAVYFFPVYYLYKFSKETDAALQSGDEARLVSAFRFLKKHFKFIVIMIFALIALYILIIIVAVIAALSGAFAPAAGASFV